MMSALRSTASASSPRPDLLAKAQWATDTFLYLLTRWIEKTLLSIEDYPMLKAHRTRMEAEEGVRQALLRQSEEPIG